MTARILIVDDIAANSKLLEARLNAEYFDVKTAVNGLEALRMCALEPCDIVLLDVMMPGMDGFEVCRRLKANPLTADISVVMVTALDQPADRVRGLEAGADDFLTKPVDEMALLARVRSLARLKLVTDELRSRVAASATFDAPPMPDLARIDEGSDGHILIVDDRKSSAERLTRALALQHRPEVEPDPQKALFRAAEQGYDLVVVSLGMKDYDALRLCGQLRSLDRTRHVPILTLAEPDDRARTLRGLDLGVNDYLIRPVDRNELLARVRIQLRRKRCSDRLRDVVEESLQLAVIDPLTGLNNRRFLETRLASMLELAAERNRPLSLMLLDIDHFKTVNDRFGHDVGDDVLKTFSARVKSAIRGVDLFCRMGGEEFIIVMPDTTVEVAAKIAERVRECVGNVPFVVGGGLSPVPVTVSIGLADRKLDYDPAFLLRRADRALYRSKHDGRNRVTEDAA